MSRNECILAIDPGKTNLGTCVLDVETREIVRWAVWSVESVTAVDVFACLRDKDFDGVTRVVIERQPAKNPSMTRMQHYLEFYFATLGVPVKIQDAKLKLAHASSTPWFPADSTDREWTYRHRKNLSVRAAAAYVRGTSQPLANVFESSKKKDDLADALWHAMAAVAFPWVAPPKKTAKKTAVKKTAAKKTTAKKTTAKKTTAKKAAPPKKTTKQPPARKPTEKQLRTKVYSASNVVWLLRHGHDPADDPALAEAMTRFS